MRPMFLGDMNLCPQCGKKRSVGNHDACAKARQALYAKTNRNRRKAK